MVATIQNTGQKSPYKTYGAAHSGCHYAAAFLSCFFFDRKKCYILTAPYVLYGEFCPMFCMVPYVLYGDSHFMGPGPQLWTATTSVPLGCCQF